MDELNELFIVFNNTMSVHLREKLFPLVKHGKPGTWKLDQIGNEILTKEKLLNYIELIQEYAADDEDTFYEDESPEFQVIQLKNYRIVITYPPLSDAIEITIVRPTISRSLDEYNLIGSLKDRFEKGAEGILIAGAPGHGKSTFASALALFYADKSKIVKTIEKPRDLQLDERITQFTILPNDIEKVGDLILLMRPDYVIFDEIRKSSDFEVYSDMRLAGIGMVGVIHATKPIDAIQRFVNRIELGMIPNIIDTVIFIKNGEIDNVLSLKIVVKTPRGFTDQSLARPVIEVRDYLDGVPLYEIFSFGEQIVVIPIKSVKSRKHKIGRVQRGNKAKASEVIEIYQTKKFTILVVESEFSNKNVELMMGPQVLMKCIVNNYGEIKLPRKKATTRRVEKILENAKMPLTVNWVK